MSSSSTTETHRPRGPSVQSASVAHQTLISVPSQAGASMVGSQVATWSRWMVPSGQATNPEDVPSVAGIATAPAHTGSTKPPLLEELAPPPAPLPEVALGP